MLDDDSLASLSAFTIYPHVEFIIIIIAIRTTLYPPRMCVYTHENGTPNTVCVPRLIAGNLLYDQTANIRSEKLNKATSHLEKGI